MLSVSSIGISCILSIFSSFYAPKIVSLRFSSDLSKSSSDFLVFSVIFYEL